VNPDLAESLKGADSLTPFGAEMRYPGDTAELLPDGESEAIDTARRVQEAVMSAMRLT
jgi:hypothetical protein